MVVLQLLLIAALTFSSTSRASQFRQLVVFGDSLTDDGVEAQGLSHGFTRFSNGPVWPEYLRIMLQTCRKYSNYAYSGAKSDADNYYFSGWSGVLWQVANYLNSTKRVPRKTLIIVQLGGSNDMFGGINKTVELTDNAKIAINSLAQKGAQKVLALNLPGSSKGGQLISTLVSEANALLEAALVSSAFSSYPSFDLQLFDLNAVTTQAMASFSNTAEPYTHHRNDTLPARSTVEITELPILSVNKRWPNDIKNYAFFDQYHPSTFAHLKIAQAIYEFVQNWN